jgi:hypothetical protein
MVRRISAEYNSKIVAEDKPPFAARPKPWLPGSDAKAEEGRVVKSASENSFKSSNFVASLLSSEPADKAADQSFRLGSLDKESILQSSASAENFSDKFSSANK